MNIHSPVPGLTERHDLHSGHPTWDEKAWAPPAATLLPSTTDIAIIGSGIMGSILAERLTAEGHDVVVIDRRPPGCGSTAASTAEIMWAMDVPLLHLAQKIGEEEAARRWKRVFAAVRSLAERIDTLGIDGDRIERPTVYLAGTTLDTAGLEQEAILHQRHDLPTDFLNASAIAERFGIAPRAALVSTGGYEVDPVTLSHALLRLAVERGGKLAYPCDVMALGEDGDRVILSLSNGHDLSARTVLLAGGYERAPLFLPPEFSLMSTYVMATAPGTAPLWRENAMLWEASDPYLYVRTTADGRVVAGGEDAGMVDALSRDRLLTEKAGTIAAKLEALLGGASIAVDRCWSATFGVSPDGLPAIGPVAGRCNVWLTAGFGGNGIAFAGLAADMVVGALAGRDDPDAACFSPYRFRA